MFQLPEMVQTQSLAPLLQQVAVEVEMLAVLRLRLQVLLVAQVAAVE
jgi:hypothetical protein